MKKVQGYKAYAQGGFTPPLLLPDAINPEQVLCHHRQAQGRYGGRHVASVIVQHPEFHINGKGILQRPKEQHGYPGNPADGRKSGKTKENFLPA